MLEIDDLASNPGTFVLAYRFLRQGEVQLGGRAHLFIPHGEAQFDAKTGLPRPAPRIWQEILRLDIRDSFSLELLSPPGRQYLENAVSPLISEFRNSAGQIAASFWGYFEDDLWQARLSPLLRLRLAWGPHAVSRRVGHDHRTVRVYLDRRAGVPAIEWRLAEDGQVSGQLEDILDSDADRPALERIVADSAIVAEVSRLFEAGRQAEARIMSR
jgi:hypothetical protein